MRNRTDKIRRTKIRWMNEMDEMRWTKLDGRFSINKRKTLTTNV